MRWFETDDTIEEFTAPLQNMVFLLRNQAILSHVFHGTLTRHFLGMIKLGIERSMTEMKRRFMDGEFDVASMRTANRLFQEADLVWSNDSSILPLVNENAEHMRTFALTEDLANLTELAGKFNKDDAR